MESIEELQLAIQENMPEEEISLSDLQKLKSETIVKYCIRFLSEMGVNMDLLMNEPVEGNEPPTDVDLKIRIVMAVKEIYPIPSIMASFRFDTLDNPVQTDVQFIANLNSFHAFVLNRSAVLLGPAMQALDELRAKEAALKKQHEELLMRCNEVAVARASRPLEEHQVNRELSDMRLRLMEGREQLQKAKEAEEELCAQLAALNKTKDEEVASLEQLEAQVAECERRDEEFQCLEALRAERAELEQEKAELLEKKRKKDKQLEQEKLQLATGQQLMGLAQELAEAADGYRAEERKKKQDMAKVAEIRRETQHVRFKIAKLKKECEEEEQRISAEEADLRQRLKEQRQEVAAATERMEQKKAKAAEAAVLRSAQLAEIEKLEQQTEGCKRAMEEARQKHEEFIDEGFRLFNAHLDAKDEKIRKRLQERTGTDVKSAKHKVSPFSPFGSV